MNIQEYMALLMMNMLSSFLGKIFRFINELSYLTACLKCHQNSSWPMIWWQFTHNLIGQQLHILVSLSILETDGELSPEEQNGCFLYTWWGWNKAAKTKGRKCALQCGILECKSVWSACDNLPVMEATSPPCHIISLEHIVTIWHCNPDNT